MAAGFLGGLTSTADAPVVSSKGSGASASNPSNTAGQSGPKIGTGTFAATPDPFAQLATMKQQQSSGSGGLVSQSTPSLSSLQGAGLQNNYNYTGSSYSPGGGGGAAALGQPIAGEAGVLINNAKSWLGVPYLYGGTSKSGVDCSGFTQAVYQSLGLNIGRDTTAQFQSGTKVGQDGNWAATVAQLKPGDLIFYGQPGASGPNAHVVMYIGNGQVMQAPHSGTTVQISPLFSSASADEPFLGARSYF